jgi:hypothetical protein
MEEGEVHCIINLDKYSEYIRKSAALSFAKGQELDESENLEIYVTITQVSQMVVENSMGMDDDGHYLITDEGCKNLFKQLQARIYNSGLSKLAAKNLVECAWDDKKNTMIFWHNESDKD